MGVYIKGMRMPESCTKCKFSYKEESYEPKEGTFYCVKTCKGEIIKSNYYTNENKKYSYSRPDYCHLIDLGKHGDLIDADELKKEFPKDTDWEYPVNTNEYVCEMIDKAHAVIEAEGK